MEREEDGKEQKEREREAQFLEIIQTRDGSKRVRMEMIKRDMRY